MNAPDSFQALRRANPRAKPGFARSVEATADRLRAQLAAATTDANPSPPRAARPHSRRHLVGLTAGASLAVAAAVAAIMAVAAPVAGPGIASAAAAVRQAATTTATVADRSGTAVVRITHDGRAWAGTTIKWHGDDIAVTRDGAPRTRPGSRLLVVDGILYDTDLKGRWVALGDPRNIDPDTGTTPDEYLVTVREDVGGATLRRIVDGMTGLTTRRLGDGSTVYSGTVAAGLIARETGFKEGQAIRVLPFGYVAHDEAADPNVPLRAAITVGADGIIREIAVTWGTSASAWTFKVAYSRLGTTPPLTAPQNAKPLRAPPRADK